jgi:hypothetical protein
MPACHLRQDSLKLVRSLSFGNETRRGFRKCLYQIIALLKRLAYGDHDARGTSWSPQCMNLRDFLNALKAPATAVSAVLAALVALTSAAYKLKTHFSRSRLLRADAFPLPEVPSEQAIFADNYRVDTMLVGRDSEISAVAGDVRSSVLTFVYGESGSGKSTFLKLGLCRELAKPGGWAPIYIDAWGSDWERGPWNALADSTDFALRAVSIIGLEAPAITRESVFERLRNLRKTVGRRPLLVFDQIDDYQNAHRTSFRRPGTQFLVTPDELCEANPFWREIRDLLLQSDEPVRLLLSTRDDAQDGLHCFEFTKPSVYQLPRLGPGDAITLVQRLTPNSIIKNPENGFTELTQRIATELGNEHAGAILPMQLRMALAGLGTLSGPLTPGRLDKLGGVAALGALYLDNVLRHSPDAWPVINAMAERSSSGQPKAIGLSRDRLLALLPAGVASEQLLNRLVDQRILRRRLGGSPDEFWQLYHDYLAAAIVELDRRKRKWFLVLSGAAQRFRLADGPIQWWLRLLTPGIQLCLFLQRLAKRGFYYGEYGGFARISLLRLFINVWTISAVSIFLGVTLWQDNREAGSIVDAFHQGDNRDKQYDALWLLATSRSDRLRRNVITEFLSTPDSAQKITEYRSSILGSLGLRASVLDALTDLSAAGQCHAPSSLYIGVCSQIAMFSGKTGPLADRIVDRLAEAMGGEAADLGQTLAVLEPEAESDHAGQGANRIVDLLAQPKMLAQVSNETVDLGRALVVLAPQVNGNQAGPLANRIVDLLAKTPAEETVGLGRALAALAPKTRGDQVERGANLIVDRLAQANAFEAGNLARALAALAPDAKGHQTEMGANRIVDLLTQEPNQARGLSEALAALAPETKGDQVERGANLIVDGLAQETKIDRLAAESSGSAGLWDSALDTLAPQVKGNQAGPLASRIVDLVDKASPPGEAPGLYHALDTLAPQVKGDQAGPLANRIANLLTQAPANEAQVLDQALATLASETKGNQAGPLANRIVDLLNSPTNEASDLGRALATLALETKGDQVERGATLIVDRLARASAFEAADLSRALATLAPETKGDQVERGANLIVDRLAQAKVSEVEAFGRAWALLALKVRGDQAERGSSLIVERLARAEAFEAASLGQALAVFSAAAKCDQAGQGANRIVDLLAQPKTQVSEEFALIQTLVVLAPQVKGNQAGPLAKRIVDLLANPTNQASDLGRALAALAPKARGDQVERGATRIVQLRGEANGSEAEAMGQVLMAIAADVDPASRKRILTRMVEQRQPLPCDLAAASSSPKEVALLLDMIKWPICEGRDGIMLRIAELQNASPLEFGSFEKASDRSTFKADRRKFIAWLRTQRDSRGKDFDIDGPPTWSPQNPPSASH